MGIQHDGARQLLGMIRKTYPRRRITYGDAAERLGRPRNHARAIAQMCDLLDAAAAYSGVPLLALVAVLDKSEQVNPKAWHRNTEPGLRDKIIERSSQYPFAPSDFAAIAEGLALLEDAGVGNRTAWNFVNKEIGDALVLAAIAGERPHEAWTRTFRPDQEAGALEGNRKLVSHFRRERDPKLAQSKKLEARTASGTLICECCRADSLSSFPGLKWDLWEVHHRVPLHRLKVARETTHADLAVLCPNCHRAIHRTKPMMQVEQFRKKYFTQKSVPRERRGFR